MTDEFKEKLRYYRRKQGWTQTMLADFVGIHPTNLSKYVNGHLDFPHDLLWRAGELLGLSDQQIQELEALYERRHKHEPSPVPEEPEMLWIPAGKFLMGSDTRRDELWREDELPQHQVDLPGFYVGETPITNAQYYAFVASAGRQTGPAHWEGKQPPPGQENHPVVHVTWRDALDYCEWLSERTSKCYRLPTEAEWEKAARGMKGCIWPWGNSLPRIEPCNYCRGEAGTTTPVRKYPSRANGLYDMAGNVWEWTSSLHRPYPYKKDDGREDRNAIGARVARGGSFFDSDRFVRCACRAFANPVDTARNRGFRIAMS